jgi:hypothetical protein
MPELGPYGSVRGALSNERPYRDLRNVVTNYLFERLHRFAGIQANSGHGDYSRLSCAVGIRRSGLMPGCQQGCLRECWSMAERAGIAAISADPEMIDGGQSSTPVLSVLLHNGLFSGQPLGLAKRPLMKVTHL